MFIRKKTLIKTAICLIIFALFIFYCSWQNNALLTTYIDVRADNIPTEFDGFKIVHISDIHSSEFGKDQKDIIQTISEIKPDIIVITGDMINHNTKNLDSVETLASGLAEICDVYFTIGNHEVSSDISDELISLLSSCGIKVLENEAVILSNNGSEINLIGMNDISLYYQNRSKSESEILFKQKLKNLCEINDNYNIVLSHRPDLIELYEECGCDLVFSGHAHGGQFRLPFIGGLYAPNQGLFPKYTSRAYALNDMTLIVNRGLGKSVIPFRINNRPDITVITLKSK